MKKEFHLTKEGVEELKEELAKLLDGRKEISERIKTARDQGDLKENAEYHQARDDQGQAEARISQIEHILKNVEIIAVKNASEVEIGNTVELAGGKGKQTYTIVGSVESDPLEGKLSNESPIGKALMGKKVGDKVEIQLPAGTTNYTIKSIA